MTQFALCRALAFLIVGTLPATVFAQELPAKKRDKGNSRVIQIDALKVEGQIQQPEAFYILQKGEVSFKGLEPKKSFVSEILETVESEPF